jgi:oxygen-dependent protoporphyrinogen oxidase
VSGRRVAIVGGGIAGVTAAWQLHRLGCEFTLYEASDRLGGIVETVRRDGFTIECGPDGWVSEKPWARALAEELGLGAELIGSNDATRVTYILSGGKLVPMPDGMRMMVPTDLDALEGSSLFSAAAREAYAREPGRADELRASAPENDESVATFVERHFGLEVLEKIGAPLLSGVFGGDIRRLSVRAVMPAFVAMEREHGSLILALRAKQSASRGSQGTVFTSLADGTQKLIDRMVAELPASSVSLNSRITEILPDGGDLILATPAHMTRKLLGGIAPPRAAELLDVEASSAVVVALAFEQEFPLPGGFGFLVPAGEDCRLLAATFVDQKFPGRVPEGGRLLRAFFGGEAAPVIADRSDDEIVRLAIAELEKVLGRLPAASFSVVRRWPLSLPQYGVGHLERVAELEGLVREIPGLWLLGNAYHGVGLPDLVRDARAVARTIASAP